ncbi:hypothetical protein Ddye_014556 [Dipteronia dyeriana]|uniref:Uncharacterized protein n=1 Tax=Dipteronia dyeriana TaxID=168575 RepID=A0AAE0CKM8_9ROSI|nr:hypothetical protein Ddye_014556 [Dipteronia dyeriana]
MGLCDKTCLKMISYILVVAMNIFYFSILRHCFIISHQVPKALSKQAAPVKDSNSPTTVKKKNHSWSSFSELNVYKIYKAVRGADASTQTGDNRTQQRLNSNEVDDSNRNDITKLSGEEVNLIG